MSSHIRIPLISVGGSEEHIDIYPDELPEDHNDLIDVLKSELAPFHVWRACATEYHRQGFDVEFDLILKEIVGALCVPDVSEIYKQREDYSEGITEIFVALAAKSLDSLAKSRMSTDSADQHSFYAKQVVAALESADENHRMHEYTWVIKGFFEIMQGDKKRAEDHFKTVYDRASKGQNYALKKHLFVSLLGLGLVSYANQKYQLALDHFTNAINNFPNCTASVRLVVACCCFKLGQYERSKLAAQRAFSLEPCNTNSLVLLSLIDQAIAKRDRSPKMPELLNNAFEYCMVASALEPRNSAVLNMLANHYFHHWTSLPAESLALLTNDRIVMPKVVAVLLKEGDELRLNGLKECTRVVQSVSDHIDNTCGDTNDTTLALVELVVEDFDSGQLPSYICSLEMRELSRVSAFASEALLHTSFREIRSESYFILGKVEHARNQLREALEYYKASQRESPEMLLSTFAIGEILVVLKDFGAALDCFERILGSNPDDKDTQAYVHLLRGLIRKEQANFDKLREVAPGFRHEIDLWLSQGQLRLEKYGDHPNALKCYMHAIDCLEQHSTPISPIVFANIAVLNFNMGKLKKALEYSTMALDVVTKTGNNSFSDANIHLNLSCAEHEGVFYAWSKPVCELQKSTSDSETSETIFHILPGSGTAAGISVGDNVQIGGIIHIVRTIEANTLQCFSPIKLPYLQSPLELRKKEFFSNFNDNTVTYCYNHAFFMEAVGQTKAASEIYSELINNHPGFIDCYIRLSTIAGLTGHHQEALSWLKRGQAVNDDDLDLMAALGDLYQHLPVSGHLGRANGTPSGRALASAQHDSDAKKCFEKVLLKNKSDARAMLSMGNIHLNSALLAKLNKRDHQDHALKDSYKFFYHVLNSDNRNGFAANGLGVVCAEKGHLDAAKDIFFKAKEAQLPQTDDVTNNLATIFLQQGRYPDAERLFQSTLKSSSALGGSNSVANGTKSTVIKPLTTGVAPSQQFLAEKRQYLHECVALAQNRMLKNEESGRSLLHAIHLSPHSSMQDWYNLASVYENAAVTWMKRKQITVREIVDAIDNIELAKTIFNFLLTSPSVLTYQQQVPISQSHVQKHWNMCTNILISFTDRLESVQVEEAERAKQHRLREEDHEERIRAKREEQERQEMLKEADKREKQTLAAQKLKQLQELQDKWVAIPASVAAPTGGHKRRGRPDKGTKESYVKTDDDSDYRGMIDAEHDTGLEYEDSISAVLGAGANSSSLKPGDSGDIDFGSSDEEEIPKLSASNFKSSAAIDTDLFGDDDEDEYDDPVASAPVPHEGAKRKARVLDDESDCGEEGGAMETGVSLPPTKQGRTIREDN